jgi:hypothetical protein
MKVKLITSALLFTVLTLEAQDRISIILPRFEHPPTIDGSIDEDVWSKSGRLDKFLELFPEEGRKPEVETEVYFGYDDENLYVGIRCHEPDINSLRISEGKRDQVDENTNDVVALILWTLDNPEAGYVFGVNPKNIQIDGYFSNQGGNIKIDFEWKSAVKIFSDRWEVEIAFPLRNLRFPNRKRQKWRFGIYRSRPRKDKFIYTCPPVTQNNPSFYDQAGFLIINEQIITRFKRYNINPYIIASQTGKRNSDGVFENDRGKARVGIDMLNIIITPNNVITFAFNPDYSTTELDIPKIDVNTTLAIYYPEKRASFFEGWDIFKITLPNLFYTRTINDPVLMGKYTGKLRNMNIGFITAYDRRTPWIVPFEEYSFPINSNLKSWVNILRLRYDRGESYVGFIGMSRDVEDGYNRVAGLDARFKIGKQNYLSIALLRSWTREINNPELFSPDVRFDGHTASFDGEKFAGNTYYIKFFHGSKNVNFEFQYKDISPNFRADNGFINRNNVRIINPFFNFRFWVNKKYLRGIFPWIGSYWRWNYDGAVKFYNYNLGVNFLFPYQINFGVYLSPVQFEKFKGLGFRKWGGGLNFYSNISKLISGGLNIWYGKGINYTSEPPEPGFEKDLSLWIFFRPISSISFDFRFNFYQLKDKENTMEIYSGDVWSGKLIYQPIKYLTIRIIVQRNSFNQRIDISPLISFEPSPFTALYIGSNNYLDEIPNIRENYHQYYLKFKYTF